jgi:hypothetical protein
MTRGKGFWCGEGIDRCWLDVSEYGGRGVERNGYGAKEVHYV